MERGEHIRVARIASVANTVPTFSFSKRSRLQNSTALKLSNNKSEIQKPEEHHYKPKFSVTGEHKDCEKHLS
jgi:hypothetical protein